MSLGLAINFHYKGAPPEGIMTADGVVTSWPAAAGSQPDQATLDVWLANWSNRVFQNEVNAERDRRIGGGFIYNGTEFQSDANSRENIVGAQGISLAAMISDPTGSSGLRWEDPDVDFSWISASNTEVTMTAAQCQAFCLAAMEYKKALIKAARILKNTQPIPQDYADDSYWPSRTLD
jgi:hypothetical protein